MADIILPAPETGFEWVQRPVKKVILVQLREERDRLQAELALMIKPTNAELIELGQSVHPYYVTKNMLEVIKNRIIVLHG